MASFRCVMYGHILYDDKLTWEELLNTESRVTALMQVALDECGARHIDFTSLADALLVECVFPDMDRDNNHALCDAVIRQLGPGVLARFMFVDRQLDSSVFYFLGRGKWQEQALSVPGPREALSGWVVRQERKTLADRMPVTPIEGNRKLSREDIPGVKQRALIPPNEEQPGEDIPEQESPA